MERYEIEGFLAVAEELHFGRAAERLLVSRARVSQTITKLERRVGAPLFERTSRRVELTALGRQLRAGIEEHHRAIQAEFARAIDTARGVGGELRLGLMAATGSMLHDAIEEFRVRSPECELRMREVHFSDPFSALRAGDIDIALLWLPVREPDLTTGPVVVSESCVLAVSSRHPFARRESVSAEDLARVRLITSAKPLPDYWENAHTPTHTPSGRPIPKGPGTATFQEALMLVAGGEAASVMGAHAAVNYARPTIAYVPLDDPLRHEWALVWRTCDETHRIRAFAQVVRDVVHADGGPPG